MFSDNPKEWLEESIQEGHIQHYQDADLLDRTVIATRGFVVVYRALVRHSGIPVAIKSLDTRQEEAYYERLVKEYSNSILICKGVAKISDFGLSDTMTNCLSKNERTLAYVDPSLFAEGFHEHGEKSDIFSLGVILWEISSGKHPCQALATREDIKRFRLDGLRDEPVFGTPVDYSKLYSECWAEDPDERPPCKEANFSMRILQANLTEHWKLKSIEC
ncbi:7562_t:CDS:2 [Paraglomus occultum]|uniref:7562_t:CDS:1 n=1 Tax=Paraglomus occultum TaxID=144539 RepID=A0A9N9A6M0_9GLOM|nr:7562_t:CDS:2 [Paraglomus occultum]